MQWHIAQLNVGRLIAPTDSPAVTDFMAALDRVNALADHSPGFVWRLQSDSGNATDIQVSADPQFLVNMSVWQSVEALFDFVYRSSHTKVMMRRRDWFEQPAQPFLCLWWVPADHIPTVAEAMARLDHLRAHGPTAHAFGFREKYPAPDIGGTPGDMKPEPYCVGWE